MSLTSFTKISCIASSASAATGAIEHLIEHTGATRLAHISDDRFVDMQQTRPRVVLRDGVTRELAQAGVAADAAASEGIDGAVARARVIGALIVRYDSRRAGVNSGGSGYGYGYGSGYGQAYALGHDYGQTSAQVASKGVRGWLRRS